MKKLFLLLFVVACGLISCEGPMGEPGEGMNWNVEKFTLRSNQWTMFTTEGNPNDIYYRAVVDTRFPGWDITDVTREFVYEKGNTFAYLYIIDEDNVESQVPLTYVQNWSNLKDETLADVFYFSFTPYDVSFYYAPSGEGAANFEPADNLTFRVVMNW